MAKSHKEIKLKIIDLLPLLLLFLISLNGSSVISIKIFSINIHYILVYFWVLRSPDTLGYGFIFLAGIISDVILGFPLGISSLSLVVVAGPAAYIRVVTVWITLINDWISFIPALLIGNFVYFISMYFSNHTVDYLFIFNKMSS